MSATASPAFFTDFYKSLCGRLTSKIINQQIFSLWPDLTGQRVLVIGWAFPYLSHLKKTAAHVTVAQPHFASDIATKTKNALYDNAGLYVDINALPFPNRSFDRILVIHGCEFGHDIPRIFDRLEQMMTDDGRLIAVVPNLSGLWRKNNNTPFSCGTAVTSNQLFWAMQHAGFAVEYRGHALSFPPSQNKRFLSLAARWEGKGQYFFSFLCGAHIFEAHKHLFSGTVVKNPTAAEIAKHQQLSTTAK